MGLKIPQKKFPQMCFTANVGLSIDCVRKYFSSGCIKVTTRGTSCLAFGFIGWCWALTLNCFQLTLHTMMIRRQIQKNPNG